MIKHYFILLFCELKNAKTSIPRITTPAIHHILFSFRFFTNVLILEIILEQGLYIDKILIDFCILLSEKIPEKYKEAITNKTEQNEYWYRKYVLDNLSKDNEILHDETLKFLQFMENWQMDEEMKEKVKEFIKSNINKIFENENIYEVFKYLIDNQETFEVNYTTKNIGKIFIDIFIDLNNENEKLNYVYEHIDKIFKKRELKSFTLKLFEKIIENLNVLNEYQYEILEINKSLLKMDKGYIEKYFEKLEDIYNNKYPFLLFKKIVESNNRKLNQDLKKDFKEKLKEIKENVKTNEIENAINEIIKIL